MNALLIETSALAGRSLRRTTRELDTLLMSLLLPVLLMLLFVGVFGGAISSRGEYVDYVVPGAILLCAAYGAAQTAVGVAADHNEGIVTRLKTMPVASGTVLIGHVVASLARNGIATLAVIGVALLLGFTPNAGLGGWLLALALLAWFVLAVTWLAVAVGLLAPNAEAASGFTFFILFVPYLSSAFVPVNTLPGGLQGIAEHQPVTPVIETLRGLLTNGPTDAWPAAVAWSTGILLVGALAAIALFRRSGQ
jgi:ABC-2 type transport system permease protein